MSLADLQALQARARMIDASVEFADALRAAGAKDVSHVIFQDEDHGTVLPAAIQRGLSFVIPHMSDNGSSISPDKCSTFFGCAEIGMHPALQTIRIL